jgi:hypothetical protein
MDGGLSRLVIVTEQTIPVDDYGELTRKSGIRFQVVAVQTVQG